MTPSSGCHVAAYPARAGCGEPGVNDEIHGLDERSQSLNVY